MKSFNCVCTALVLFCTTVEVGFSFVSNRIYRHYPSTIFRVYGIPNAMDPELRRLLDSIKGLEVEDIPPEVLKQIEAKALQYAPNDFQVRMQIMGVTPLTVAGFALAGVLLILNYALGNGWAGGLLGIDGGEYERVRAITSGNPIKQTPEQLEKMRLLQGDNIINYADIEARLKQLRDAKE